MKTAHCLLVLVLAASLAGAQEPPAPVAGVPTPPDEVIGVSIVHDPLHTAETIAHFIVRLQEHAQKVLMVQNQLQNLKAIDEWRWRDAARDFHELNHILVQREGIVFPRHDLEERWLETFQVFEPIDYDLYPDGADELTRQRVERTIDTLWGVMRATRHHTVRLNDGQTLLEEIKNLAEKSDGNLDSAHVRQQLQTFSAEEIAGIRHLLAVQTNLQIIESMYRLSTQAQGAESLLLWINESSAPLTGFGFLASNPDDF